MLGRWEHQRHPSVHQQLPLAVHLHPPLVGPPHPLEARAFTIYLQLFQVEAIFKARKDIETVRQAVLTGFGAASGGLFGGMGGPQMSVDFAMEY